MEIKVKVVKRGQPGIPGGGKMKYYAQVSKRSKVGTEKISRIIEKNSALTESEVVGILSQLATIIPDLLMDGKTVELDHLGLFSLHVRSEGSTDPNKISGKSIREARIHFRPSVRLKKRLKSATYKVVQQKI